MEGDNTEEGDVGVAGKQALQRMDRHVLRVAMGSQKNADTPPPPPPRGPVIEPETSPVEKNEAQGGE